MDEWQPSRTVMGHVTLTLPGRVPDCATHLAHPTPDCHQGGCQAPHRVACWGTVPWGHHTINFSALRPAGRDSRRGLPHPVGGHILTSALVQAVGSP